MKKTIEIPLQVRIAALGSISKENRTARLTWSTGAAVKRMDFWTGERWIEELSMDPAHIRLDRLNGGAPLLNSHSKYDLRGILGVTERAWVEGGEGMADVRFSRRPDVEPMWNDVQDGIIRNVSVGYQVHKFEDVSTPEDMKARMRRLRAVDWEPTEISLVPVGADAKAGVRAEAEKNPCEVEFSERNPAGVPDELDGEAARNGPPTDSLTVIRERFEFDRKVADFDMEITV